MIITTPALAAAWRIRERSTVRVHEAKLRAVPLYLHPVRDAAAVAQRREQIRALLGTGLSEREIAVKLNLTRTAIQMHKRALRAQGVDL